MKRVCLWSVVVVLVLLSPLTANAQERGQTGLTMGFPTSVGFIWHATDRLAIRPEITFSSFSSESENNILFLGDDDEDDNGGSAFTTVVSALWYLRPAENNVRPYLSPRFTYGRASTDDLGPESTAWSLTGSFGVQYTPVRRFAVYGEVGFGRSQSESTLSTPIGDLSQETTSWSTRSAVGVIFYFR